MTGPLCASCRQRPVDFDGVTCPRCTARVRRRDHRAPRPALEPTDLLGTMHRAVAVTRQLVHRAPWWQRPVLRLMVWRVERKLRKLTLP